MTNPVWITPAGFLGTLTERKTTSTTIVAEGTGISYSVISGSLPIGMYINSTTGRILGTPGSVKLNTDYKFAVRASNTSGVTDRSFSYQVTGPTEPVWVTPAGDLPVGMNGEHYTINKEWVDYSLRADTDLSSSKLSYYIADRDGQLPPGLRLTKDGRIYGYVNDVLGVEITASPQGGYDADAYDSVVYENSVYDKTTATSDSYINKYDIIGITQENPIRVNVRTPHNLTDGDKILIGDVEGMIALNGNSYLVKVIDDFIFSLYKINYIIDNITGLSVESTSRDLITPIDGTLPLYYAYSRGGYVYWGTFNPNQPKNIKKIYQFYITASDGIASTRRRFSIEVVDHDSLRVDTSYLSVDSALFDVSASYLLTPIWQSKNGNKLPRVGNLGSVRAGKKLILDTYDYDPYPQQGPVFYDWNTAKVNPDIKLTTDGSINSANLQTTNLQGNNSVYYKNAELTPVKGMKICFGDYIPNTDNTIYTITGVIPLSDTSGILNIDQALAQQIPDSRTFYVGTPSVHPPGINLDPNTGSIYGQLANQPTYSQTYRFTIKIVKIDQTSGDQVLFDAIGDSDARIINKLYTTVTAEPPVGAGGLTAAASYTGSKGDIWLVGKTQPVTATFLLPYMDGTLRAYVFTGQDNPSWVYIGEVASNSQVYLLSVVGNISSSISFSSTSSLGALVPGEVSELVVKAVNTGSTYKVEYEIIQGTLPPGLIFNNDGTIQGKVINTGQTYFDFQPPVPVPNENFRPYNGRNNNILLPNINSVGSTFGRIGPANYDDGIHTMQGGRPNPRSISNTVVAGTFAGQESLRTNSLGLSAWMYVWGQFVTHDIGFEDIGVTTEFIPITVPADDQFLTPGSFIPMTRATVAPGTGGVTGIPAAAINDTTGWLDASVVYGYTVPPDAPQPVNSFRNPIDLRDGGSIATTGKLTTSEGDHAPIYTDPTFGPQFFFGDPRGNENPDLITIQTLMLREHNWHVDALSAAHPEFNGEELYQHARAVVTAEFQQITYNEWLPNLLGPGAIPEYTGYNQNASAPIPIEFDAAALRFGHSIVSAAVSRVSDEGEDVGPLLQFNQATFMNPADFVSFGGVSGFCRHISGDLSNELDVYIINDLRNLLNDPPVAIDLASINIQRGRDLGLGTLNQTRLALGLLAHGSFSDITSDPIVAANLETIYTNVDTVELWIGGLAEDHYNGGMLGRTFHEIVKRTFIKLRDGDRFWWENQGMPPEVSNWVAETTLADIILRNTDTSNIQQQVFVQTERLGIDTFEPPIPIIGSSPNAVATARTSPYAVPAGERVPLTFDKNATTTDKNWYITVRASDAYRLSAVEKQFYVTVFQDTLFEYTRIYVKPFLPKLKRSSYKDFVTDAVIFDPLLLYRPADPEFGTQQQIKMVLETGIQKVSIDEYATAINSYFYRKRFYFGDVKSIKAQDRDGNYVYDLIYVDIVDDQMNGVFAPTNSSSVVNMQGSLESIVLSNSATISLNERLQPRYMTTLQQDTGVAIGFVKAVPICYTIPGGSVKILSRINNAIAIGQFSFNDYNFETDRIIIESTTDSNSTEWLLYPTARQ